MIQITNKNKIKGLISHKQSGMTKSGIQNYIANSNFTLKQHTMTAGLQLTPLLKLIDKK